MATFSYRGDVVNHIIGIIGQFIIKAISLILRRDELSIIVLSRSVSDYGKAVEPLCRLLESMISPYVIVINFDQFQNTIFELKRRGNVFVVPTVELKDMVGYLNPTAYYINLTNENDYVYVQIISDLCEGRSHFPKVVIYTPGNADVKAAVVDSLGKIKYCEAMTQVYMTSERDKLYEHIPPKRGQDAVYRQEGR